MRAAAITIPTLIMNGSATRPYIRDTVRALAKVIPRAQYRELEGETHDVSLEVLAPVLVEFFQARLGRERPAGRRSRPPPPRVL